MYKKYLKDNTCFVVPSSIKKEILFYISSNKIIVDICFYTIEELKKNILFDYNEKTIYFLCKKYNLSYNDSLLMIQNMYYLNDQMCDDPKILKLKEMKQYLDENNLLHYSENFLQYINSKNIVTTYGKTDFITDYLFNRLNNVTFIEKDTSFKHSIYEFGFIEDEIEYVAHNIATLLDNGININSIKLVNAGDEYSSIIEKIFNFYNIPINMNKKIRLYDLNIIKSFIDLLKNNNINTALELFKDKYDLNNNCNLNIYNKIINVLNNYYFINDYSNDIEFIIEGLKNTYIKENKLINCIDIIRLEEIINDDYYYFLIGFNNKFPKFYKDEDYLSDKTKILLGYKDSNQINKNIKNYYISKINSTKNLSISYKLKDYFNSYLVSTLVDEVNSELIKNYELNSDTSYSKKYDKVKLSKYLDDFYKFSHKNPNLGILYNTYGKDEYDSYDNSYKGIKSNKYIDMKENKLSLSYSSLDEYYKCGFRYYLNNVLNEKEDSFAIYIGNLYHEVLSKIYDDNFDFEESYNEALSKRELTNKEEILLIKLKEELKQNITLLKNQLKNSSLKRSVCEGKIEIDIKSKASVVLKGFIDKIMISDDKQYAYVVDYKTGKPKIDFDNLSDGLNMQLAIYMYLMSKSSDYANVFLVGCYLQKILDDDVNKDELKLEGYTFNDVNTIKLIDNNYLDKSFISGIKVKKDGSLSDSKKLFDSSYYEEILSIVEQKIEEAINNIINAKFDINPKVVKGENISCKFCKYKDICYKKYKDSVVISQAGDEDE